MTPRGSKKVLSDALDLFETYEWVQGEYSKRANRFAGVNDPLNPIVGFCAVGALQHIDGPHEGKAIVRLAKSVLKLSPEARTKWERDKEYERQEYGSRLSIEDVDHARNVIISFNDNPATTREEVLEAFRDAIKSR